MQASEEVVRKLLEEEQKLARSIEHQALQDEELARQILLEEKEQVNKIDCHSIREQQSYWHCHRERSATLSLNQNELKLW